MDSILEFLVTLALVVLFSVPSLLKKKKEKEKEKERASRPPRAHFPDGGLETSPDGGSVLHNSPPDIPNGNEYFTYETLEDEAETSRVEPEESPRMNAQPVENKKEEEPLLTLEPDEVLKGVVYSEILKRKF